MKKLFFVLLAASVVPVAAAHAQATILPGGAVAPPPKQEAPAAPADASAAPLIAPSPVTPAADPTALKVKADINPVTNKLMVRSDAPGPTRVEINDVSGRPVLTHNMMVGTTPAALDVSKLPAGSYVVKCSAGERTGTRRIIINN